MVKEAMLEANEGNLPSVAAPVTPPDSGERTVSKGRTKKSQEISWGKIRQLIERYVRERPQDHIATFLADLREIDISRKDPSAFYRTRDLVRPMGQKIMAAVGQDLEDPFYYPDVRAERYTTSTISPIRYLMGCIRKDTTAIVEFGSGWSTNLFQIYVGHGTTRSASIGYHGAEYTIEGQECAKRLAQHDGKINYFAHSFDYRKPNIAFLRKYTGHILVFTRHSIEQVQTINPSLYEDLCSLRAQVTIVHIEPVGWQRSQELMRRRADDDAAFFGGIGETIDGDIVSVERQLANAAWWSWRLSYNTNLLSIIEDYCGRKKGRLVKREYDFSGVGNIMNPSSLFHVELW
ncbi:hypothetical protein RB623_26335 [Mesorhizobium sp. LHD-90]|uniref:hypothetical protein n=1 Tax=Mesorhizobium sp. LHD-90 TaxID=3071414 RepID=UPI0027DF18E5|nr:hypothetical protein [Mesorhizobium sp. LHD-90]MDQ6437586.1 hypothetical protein [Mesorhizobium sp. LHD-90]